jgi:hypothetical protein
VQLGLAELMNLSHKCGNGTACGSAMPPLSGSPVACNPPEVRDADTGKCLTVDDNLKRKEMCFCQEFCGRIAG